MKLRLKDLTGKQLFDKEQVTLLLKPYLKKYSDNREMVFVLACNSQNKIKSIYLISIGSDMSALFDLRQTFWFLIKEQAYSFVVAHNHPSGNPLLSHEDVMVVGKLKKASELLGFKMLDFIVI